jgi:hypothetical protein
MQTLNYMPENSKLIIDATKSVNIDLNVIEIIEEIKAAVKKQKF